LRNTLVDQQRRRRIDPASARLTDDDPPAHDATHDDARASGFRRIVADEIAAALEALPEEHRAVILLDVEGMTEGEIATVLDCPIGTVKSRLSRARTALRARHRDY
jgi:RNA polymerase sigma-70 factor (ECF subfamily)